MYGRISFLFKLGHIPIQTTDDLGHLFDLLITR